MFWRMMGFCLWNSSRGSLGRKIHLGIIGLIIERGFLGRCLGVCTSDFLSFEGKRDGKLPNEEVKFSV